MLNVIDLHTHYGDSHVLQGVSLDAVKGAVTAVVGRNGVGKTTLCRSLVGFTRPSAGQILLDGVDVTALPPHEIWALGVSLVPQGRRLFPSLTVDEHLAIAARPAVDGGGWSRAQIFSLFPRLAERRNHRGDRLSGGEQQMLAIARALAANPRLLVMDEPTEGLAPALVAAVADLIARVKSEQVAVLLVEQNAAFAVRVADSVHVMSKGTIVHSSSPADLWKDDAVKLQLLGVPPPPASERR
jgi:branched-chain amino acid transport system ATP-binding protein